MAETSPLGAAGGSEQVAPPPVVIVRTAYDLLFAGDLEGFLGCLDENCILVEADTLPYGGRHVGRETIRATVMQIMGLWSEFRFDIEEMLAGDTSVIAYGQMVVRARATGIEARFRLAERWVVEEGSVREITAIYGDTALALGTLGTG